VSKSLEILKKNQLSVTGSREKILDLFLNAKGALAHADIEKSTGSGFDRVIIYLLQTTVLNMRFAGTTVRRVTITTIMFILFVTVAIKRFVLMM